MEAEAIGVEAEAVDKLAVFTSLSQTQRNQTRLQAAVTENLLKRNRIPHRKRLMAILPCFKKVLANLIFVER